MSKTVSANSDKVNLDMINPYQTYGDDYEPDAGDIDS